MAGGRREIDIFLFPDLYSVLCYFFYFVLQPYGGSVGVAGGNLILFYLCSIFLFPGVLYFILLCCILYMGSVSDLFRPVSACFGFVSTCFSLFGICFNLFQTVSDCFNFRNSILNTCFVTKNVLFQK